MKNSKKVLSILLSAMVLINMMPGMVFTTYAAGITEVATTGDFGSAIASGGEIKLTNDISYDSSAVTIVGETSIDLNGHTLNITTPSTERYSIKVGTSVGDTPKLTIKDSSTAQTGTLNVSNTYTTRAAYIFEVYGSMYVEGGTINQTASKASSYGIDMCSGGIFQMSGGVIKKGTSIGTGYSLRTSTSSSTTITGGVVEDYYATTGLTITGGYFKTEPTYEQVGSGKISYKITEGKYKDLYGIKDGTYIGLVGTTAYTSVEQFAKALSSTNISVEGNKLTLTADVNLGSATANKVTFISDITIDLAGHNITGAVAGSSAYMFYINKDDATVKIMDSSTGKTGMVQNSTSGYCYTIGVNRGTLIVDGAKIVGKTTGTSTTTVITNGSSSTKDAKTILQNKASVVVDNGSTAKSSSTGIQNYGICEIDDSTIDVTSGSGGTGISPYNSSQVLKIGAKGTGKTTINVKCTGLNTTQAVTLCGIGKGSTGGSGEIFISNADISLITDKGSSTKAQTCYAVNFGAESSGSYDISDNVSIKVSGTSGADNTVYGIYAFAGKISGSNVHIDVEGENASKRYGIYRNQAATFSINPGTNVSIEVNKNACIGGENYITYANSSGKTEILDGTYTGGIVNGALIKGGTFDTDPSDFCELGYIIKKDPSTGLWSAVPDDRVIVKNLTQNKEYGSIVKAVEEAHDHEELQLMEDINSNSELTLSSINLDLNGHNISLNKINTTGDVTITDKKATSFDDAGKLTAAINIGSGNTLITKCKHSLVTGDYKLRPFSVTGTVEAPSQLTISGVKGDYEFTGSSQFYIVNLDANGKVEIGSVDGFETDLSMTSAGQSPKLVYAVADNSSITINDGSFSIECTNTIAGTCSLFNKDSVALVNGGKFKLHSRNATGAKISDNTSSTINIQGGFYYPEDKNGEVALNDFFANATSLGSNGKSAKALASSDPMYALGYRYSVVAEPVAKIGGTTYTSISQAIEEATPSDTILLLSDAVLNEFTLTKNVNINADGHTVKLNGNKPLTLAAGIDKPDCFDISDAILYLEKNNGEKIYYKYWITYSTPNTGAVVDYNSTDYKQIVLAKDMKVSSALTINKTCTIDLNGFSIIGNGCDYETLQVKSKGVVCTVKDSSTAKTGKISGNNNDFYTVLLNNDGSDFVLESGIVENTSVDGAGICVISDGYHDPVSAKITINGGAIKTNRGYAIVDNGNSSSKVDININGGEITSDVGVAIYHPASGTITLKGGTITGNTPIFIRSGKLVVPTESTVKVLANGAKGAHNPNETGGVYFTGDAIVIYNSKYPGGAPSADINGGFFYSKNANAIASYAITGQKAIAGFLKGGFFGAKTDSIAINYAETEKDLIAKGYEESANADPITMSDYPWLIGKIDSGSTSGTTPSAGEGGGILVPVSGSKGSADVKAEIVGDSAKIETVTKEDISKIGTGKAVTIDVSDVKIDGKTKEISEVTLTKDTIDNVKDSKTSTLIVKLSTATLEIDKTTLTAVSKQAEGTDIHLVVDRDEKAEMTLTEAQEKTIKKMSEPVVLDAYFISNGKRITDFQGGTVKILVEYPTDKPIRIWYVADDGHKEEIPSSFNSNKKIATFEAEHFSHYVVETILPEIFIATGKVKNTSNEIKWNSVNGADGYDLYFSDCGHHARKIISTKAHKYTKKNLDRYSAYKYFVKAYKIEKGKKKVIAKTPIIHIAGEKNAYSNATKLTINAKDIKLKPKKTKFIKAKIIKTSSNKNVLWKDHTATKIRYKSSDRRIVRISSRGKITANKVGKAYIYAYAASGVYKKVLVSVE